MRSDPNGHPWLDWKKYGYASHEAFIESKAGACPEWPQEKPPPYTPPDDEGESEPDA